MWKVLPQAADPESMGGEPGPEKGLEEFENLFTLSKAVEKNGHGTDVNSVSSQPQKVTGNAIELGHHDSDVARPLRNLDSHESLDPQNIAVNIGNCSNIIGPVVVGNTLDVRAVLADLFDTPVKVADKTLAVLNSLPVQVQFHPQDSVGRGVLRPHVDFEFFGVKDGFAQHRSTSRDLADSEVLVNPGLILQFDVVVFPQRVPVPVIRQQDALQVGMAAELNAKHVKDLALHPVGRLPDRTYGRGHLAFSQT